MNAPCFFEEVINRQQNLWAITKRIPHPTGWGILFGMCRSTGELAASTCAKRVKSRGEAGLLRMATAIRGMPGSEFEPRRPLHKSPPIWVVIFFAFSPALTVVSTNSQPLPRLAVGMLPRNRLASSAAGGASALSSSPAPKRNTIRQDGVFFLEQHFCCAKVVACGRVIEREWGNPSKVPPSHSPFLAVGGSADNKTCGQSQKSPPIRVVIFFAFSPALTVVSAGSQPLDTSSNPPRFFRRRRRFGAFLHAKKSSHLPDGSLFVCCVSSDAAGSCRRCGRPPAR